MSRCVYLCVLWFDVPSGVTFYSQNPGVATINSSGFATAVAPGSTNLHGAWTGTVYYSPGVAGCATQYVNASPAASCDVQELQPHHVRVIVDQAGFPSGCAMTPVYVRQIQVHVYR
jgi:hypothetical protein